jgi:HPt (histidine-containing phosphotransfer) domain-containing protein
MISEPQIEQETFDNLKDMVGPDFVGELLDAYFEEAPRLIAEMRQALIDANAQAFQRAAHSFKSNCASFGAVHLASQARELEAMGRDERLQGAAPVLAALEQEYAQVEQALRSLL